MEQWFRLHRVIFTNYLLDLFDFFFVFRILPAGFKQHKENAYLANAYLLPECQEKHENINNLKTMQLGPR